jgi:hypothetical protein
MPMSTRRDRATALVLVLVAAPALAQTPEPSPASPAASSVHSSAADSQALLDQIAGCVDSGKLHVEVKLQAGRVPVAPVWTVEVIGTPTATLVAEATGGRVRRLDFTISAGEILVAGKGLRPALFVDSLRFEEGKGITEARYRGRGLWKPIVWVFRGLAKSALRKLELRTDVPSVLRGEVLASKSGAASATSPPASAGVSSSVPAAPEATFLDLVREVHIDNSEFAAFGGRSLGLGEMVEFRTALQPKAGMPLRVAVDKGTYRPARGDHAAQLDVFGRIDGEIENGSVAFVGGRSSFSYGELKAGAFEVRSGEDGTLETAISADVFAVDLTSGQFQLPGGPKVGVETPSRFAVRGLRLRPGGSYSGIVDAELFGKVGTISRGGNLVSLSNVKLRTQGAAVVNGRATGDLQLEFEYRLDYSLVVRYPVEQIGERRVPLRFQGPFATRLHLQDAGSGDEGVVTGEYEFKVPWPPIEQAAFEVLRAKWSQDIPAGIRKVDFIVEPQHFGPCGGNCFVVDVVVTAAKPKTKGYLFRQICDAQGKADLVVDAPSRSFVLRNVRIEPRCKGLVGWLVNLIGPLLTKTYSDVTLFQLPEDVPFTIESVSSGADWLAMAGKVAWASKASEPPSKPFP